jgi:hypothetical protein
VAAVDDGAGRAFSAVRAHAHQETRHRLDRLLGRREADAQQPVAAERGQPLERQRQMGTALIRRHGVNLVDDHGADGGEHRAPGFRPEQDVERFRRGDDDVRRAAAHAFALARGRIAGPHPGADVHVRQALLAQGLANAGKRRFEVALDVVRQCLERGDIDDLRLVREPAVEPLAHQRVDRRQEGGERLAGPGRGRDQHMPAVHDGRPGLRLCRGRGGEAAVKPRGNGRMKQRDWMHGTWAVRQKVTMPASPKRWQALTGTDAAMSEPRKYGLVGTGNQPATQPAGSFSPPCCGSSDSSSPGICELRRSRPRFAATPL